MLAYYGTTAGFILGATGWTIGVKGTMFGFIIGEGIGVTTGFIGAGEGFTTGSTTIWAGYTTGTYAGVGLGAD